MSGLFWLNACLEIAWIGATVFLIVSDHSSWAVATFIAALLSGYSWKRNT